jgi:hypothetical protein
MGQQSVSSYDLVSCIFLQSHLEPVPILKQKFSSFLKNKATTLRSKTKSCASCELLLLLPEIKTVYHFERESIILNERIMYVIQGVPGGKVNIPEGHSIGHFKKNVYMNMCSVPNSFRYLGLSILNLARNTFLPFYRNAPMSEACESV